MLDKNDNPEQQKNDEQQSTPSPDGQKHPAEELRAEQAPGQCRYIKSDSNQCQAKTRHGSLFCFVHDPESAEEREAARIKGGKERSRKAAVLAADTPNAPLKSAAEVTAFLADTINQVRRGEIDPRISNAVGYLAGILLKAKQHDEVEQRLARLESILRSKWKDPATLRAIPESGSFEFVNSQSGGEV